MRNVILAIAALGACNDPGGPLVAFGSLPDPHASARYLTGTWERFDEHGQLEDRWRLDDGAFAIWTKVDGGGQYFGDYSDVRGTYTADDQTLHLVGATREGWPFRYDCGYYADEATLIRTPYVMTAITQEKSTWSANDELIDMPTGSAYPFDTRLAPTLVFHADGTSHLFWDSPLDGIPETELGAYWSDGRTITIDTYGERTTFDLVGGGTLAQHVDDALIRGLGSTTFFHPRLLGLRYRRAATLPGAACGSAAC